MKWVILTLLIASVIGIWIVSRQAYSKWWLNLRMFKAIDEAAGIKRFEAEYAKRMRDRWGWIHPCPNWWWPHPDLAGIMSTPHSWRRKLYVWIGFEGEKPLPEPYRKEDIHVVTITYTMEASHDDETLFLAIEKGVARALSLPWHEHLFERDHKSYPHARGLTDHRPDRDQVSLIVATRRELPHSVSAAEILNGRAGNGPE